MERSDVRKRRSEQGSLAAAPRRVTLVVTVDLDSTGYGTFSTWDSARECVEAILCQSISHYNPQVNRP